MTTKQPTTLQRFRDWSTQLLRRLLFAAQYPYTLQLERRLEAARERIGTLESEVHSLHDDLRYVLAIRDDIEQGTMTYAELWRQIGEQDAKGN